MQIKNLPALRHDIFLTAFEKIVAEYQKKIEKINRLQKLYEIVRTNLEACRYSNPTKLKLEEDFICLTIKVFNDDSLDTFNPLFASIGKELKQFKFHDTGEISIPHSYNTTYCSFIYKWKIITFDPHVTIRVDLDVPHQGTRFIQVRRTKTRAEAYDYEYYNLTWLDQPQETPWVITKPVQEAEEIPF